MKKNPSSLDPLAVAEAYYALPLHERTFKALAGRLGLLPNKATTNRLARIVRDVEDRGLIRHEVLRGKTEFLPRNPRLENDLRHRFALRQAIVVDTSGLNLPNGLPADQPGPWNHYDDELHEHLGDWAGRALTSCLRSGDKIAIGGGRGPYFTILKSNVCATHRYSGDILPLTGQISARAWNRGSSRDSAPPYLDADNVAAQLHCKLGTRGRLRSLTCPITELKRTPNTDDVDVAIFGIGALGGGHRLKHFEQLDDVKSVRLLLREINALAQEIEHQVNRPGRPFFHPIGDVCNCYFVIEHEHGGPAGKPWRELETKVRQLNTAFKSATTEALGRIARQGMVLAVAGGPHKADAIRHVLRNSRETTWITHLVTDHETARWILEQEHAAAPRPDPALPAAPGP